MSAQTRRPEPVPAEALAALAKAIAEFNSWRFYDCHETLEDAWRDLGGKASRRAGGDPGMADFYQGVIKAAAGFHHLLRGNRRGTLNLLSDAVRLLEPFRPGYLGVDVERLAAAVLDSLRHVEALEESRLGEFDRGMIPRIESTVEG